MGTRPVDTRPVDTRPEEFRKKIVYVYDAYCPWCYAFTAVVRNVRDYFGDHFEYEVLSGGMYRDDGVRRIEGEEEAARMREAYARITEMTGTTFGEAFYDGVARGRRLDSERPAIGLAALRLLRESDRSPSTADPGPSDLDFAHGLLRQVFDAGGDPNTPDFYEGVARELGVDGAALLAAMERDEARDGALYDFALARQLGADGFPRLYLQTAEHYLHLIAKGYAPFERVHTLIEKIESS